MSEIVNRLRGQEPSITNYWGRTELEQIAATEIERLEAEVSRLTNLAQEGRNGALEKAATADDKDCSFCCATENPQNKHHLGPYARICSQCVVSIVERSFSRSATLKGKHPFSLRKTAPSSHRSRGRRGNDGS